MTITIFFFEIITAQDYISIGFSIEKIKIKFR